MTQDILRQLWVEYWAYALIGEAALGFVCFLWLYCVGFHAAVLMPTGADELSRAERRVNLDDPAMLHPQIGRYTRALLVQHSESAQRARHVIHRRFTGPFACASVVLVISVLQFAFTAQATEWKATEWLLLSFTGVTGAAFLFLLAVGSYDWAWEKRAPDAWRVVDELMRQRHVLQAPAESGLLESQVRLRSLYRVEDLLVNRRIYARRPSGVLTRERLDGEVWALAVVLADMASGRVKSDEAAARRWVERVARLILTGSTRLPSVDRGPAGPARRGLNVTLHVAYVFGAATLVLLVLFKMHGQLDGLQPSVEVALTWLGHAMTVVSAVALIAAVVGWSRGSRSWYR